MGHANATPQLTVLAINIRYKISPVLPQKLNSTTLLGKKTLLVIKIGCDCVYTYVYMCTYMRTYVHVFCTMVFRISLQQNGEQFLCSLKVSVAHDESRHESQVRLLFASHLLHKFLEGAGHYHTSVFLVRHYECV